MNPNPNPKLAQTEFPEIFQEDDHILDYYSCALLGGILLQGFVYISYSTLCFYANIFGVITKEAFSFRDVLRIEKAARHPTAPDSHLCPRVWIPGLPCDGQPRGGIPAP